MAIKRSDVVFMYASTSEKYRQYDATLVAWGGRPRRDDEEAIEAWRRRIEEARAVGVRQRGHVDFRVAFAGMIDFDPQFMDSVCRGLDGEPITVPWLWDHKHKGHPAYWFCTNSPRYRVYLRQQAKLALSADLDGLHIDDYNGTAGTHWQGGCFCSWCMAAFREYLKENVPQDAVDALGIGGVDDFDYGEFLRGRGVTREQFRKQVEWYPPKLPLAQEFLTFQYAGATAWIREYRKYAEGLAGHPLAISVNSQISDPKNLFIAPTVTHFVGEVKHEPDSRAVPTAPIFSYKLGDALQRPVVCTGMGWDWAYVKEHEVPGLVRTWIAQAYAYGHNFMAPVRMWCYTKEKGTHWYESKPGDYEHLYRFVREHAELFDGYEAVAHVGLLYSNPAFRRWQRQATDACAQLALKNVPFRLLLAGDDWMPNRLRSEDLRDLQAIVVTEPMHLDPDQQAVLDAAKDRTVVWPDERRLLELLPPQIRIQGAANVIVVPRAKPGDPGAPFVCHLLNRNYVPDTDSMQVQSDFTLTLGRSLFGADIARATLYAPGEEPVECQVTQSPDATEIAIPELDIWSVLKIERG